MQSNENFGFVGVGCWSSTTSTEGRVVLKVCVVVAMIDVCLFVGLGLFVLGYVDRDNE